MSFLLDGRAKALYRRNARKAIPLPSLLRLEKIHKSVLAFAVVIVAMNALSSPNLLALGISSTPIYNILNSRR